MSRVARRKRLGVGGSTNTSVEILLIEDVSSLGQRGEIVRVKPGYARNFLLPQGLATVATEANKRMVEKHKERIAEAQAERRRKYKKLAEEISKYSVTLEANANKDSQLYGSIGPREISEQLKAANFDVEPEHILLEGAIRELGMYNVKVRLIGDVESEVKVWIVPAAAAE